MTDPTPADETELEDSPERDLLDQTVQEARESFTLADMLRGARGKLPTGKELIFLDVEQLRPYQELSAREKSLSELVDSLADVKDLTEHDKEIYEQNVADLQELRDEIEPIKAAIFERALVVHFRAYPDVAVKRAQREARKIFFDPKTGAMKEDMDNDDVADWMEKRLIGEAIVKVVDSSGQEPDFGVPRTQLGFEFAAALHPGQWMRLVQKYQEIALLSGISNDAVEDPGF
jgi:hypothetical protein